MWEFMNSETYAHEKCINVHNRSQYFERNRHLIIEITIVVVVVVVVPAAVAVTIVAVVVVVANLEDYFELIVALVMEGETDKSQPKIVDRQHNNKHKPSME